MGEEQSLSILPTIAEFTSKLSEHVSWENAYQVAIISDTTLIKLYPELFAQLEKELSATVFIIPSGEANKTREQKAVLEDKLFATGFNRNSLIIALGGGVVCDLAGFLAATFCRGVSLILCPTTLLAMVDASIGGKTAVNIEYGKNLIGAFYPAKQVIIAVEFLKTLDKTNYYSGLSELLKHFMLADQKHFDELLKIDPKALQLDQKKMLYFLKHSLAVKQQIVDLDPKEKNLRVILNLGHTVAHALETVSNHEIPHGLAVWLGLLIEWQVQLGNVLSEDYSKLLNWIKKLDVNWLELFNLVSPELLYRSMCCDKKNQQQLPQMVIFSELAAYQSLFETFSMDQFSDLNSYIVQIEKNSFFAAFDFIKQTID